MWSFVFALVLLLTKESITHEGLVTNPKSDASTNSDVEANSPGIPIFANDQLAHYWPYISRVALIRSRGFGKRDDLATLLWRLNFPVAASLRAGHDLPIMPENNVLADMSQLQSQLWCVVEAGKIVRCKRMAQRV